ncbi:hypothetical protein C5Y96_06715 [Blastopirellula marina]|uniref:Uncharacterized protein n=1 Tax=Blastopirellula marina TaxID=124 RepID=A0A2S8FXE6_9BACT|nr:MULTISPECIES: hypothetical protein [Pirellulaceae]PQO36852.1 hypothetical protein C5Y96_06715 [Blastopirellula marina]RCS53567.1 hypothetical protein DTL36_06725 [Bremerella cremea]
MIRTPLAFATLIASVLLVSNTEAAWRRAWRGRSVQQTVPATQNVYTRHDRSALPRSEFRGFGFGGYGYGSGFGPDFRPGRW